MKLREINPKSHAYQDPVDGPYEQDPFPVAFELAPEALGSETKVRRDVLVSFVPSFFHRFELSLPHLPRKFRDPRSVLQIRTRIRPGREVLIS